MLISLQGPIIGAIYDHLGPRWLLIIGSLLHVFGIMMASLSTEYYQIILAQGLCSAIGVSAIFQPGTYAHAIPYLQYGFFNLLTISAVTCVIGWFDQRRGAAFGILFTGSSLRGVVFPIMLSHPIREIGFGWAMRIAAFIMLFLLVIANLTVRA